MPSLANFPQMQLNSSAPSVRKLTTLYVGPTLSLNLEFVPSLLPVLQMNGKKSFLKYTGMNLSLFNHILLKYLLLSSLKSVIIACHSISNSSCVNEKFTMSSNLSGKPLFTAKHFKFF